MRKSLLAVLLGAVLALAMIGCGSGETAGEETPAAETSPTAAESESAATWTTVATLKSTDKNKVDGVLVSKAFDVTGTARLVLDMPSGGDTDGVIVAVIPAGKAKDAATMVGAISEDLTVTLLASGPPEEVSGLDGTYVIINSVPFEKAWSVEVQTAE